MMTQPGTGFSGMKCRSHTGTAELKFTTEKNVVTLFPSTRHESWTTEKVANAELGRIAAATTSRTSKLFFIVVSPRCLMGATVGSFLAPDSENPHDDSWVTKRIIALRSGCGKSEDFEAS